MEGHHFVHQSLSAKSRSLDRTNWPAFLSIVSTLLYAGLGSLCSVLQRDMDAIPSFSIRGLDHTRGQQVQRAIHIFLPVFVEQAPGTALRHVLYAG